MTFFLKISNNKKIYIIKNIFKKTNSGNTAMLFSKQFFEENVFQIFISGLQFVFNFTYKISFLNVKIIEQIRLQSYSL